MENIMIEVVEPVPHDGRHLTTRLKDNYPKTTFWVMLVWLVVGCLIYDYSPTISISVVAMYFAFMVVAVTNEDDDIKKETIRRLNGLSL
jgi:hypothetical protein